MELSMLAAKALSIFYIAVGVGVISGQIDLNKVMKDFDDSPAWVLISGFFMVMLGTAMVTYHNIWVKDWPVLITLISWGLLIKGVSFIAFPRFFVAFKGYYKNLSPMWGFAVIALGLMFGYFGF